MSIKHARSATRHRISRQRSRYVIETTSVIFAQAAPDGSALADRRLVFLGPDAHGELLEVMAIETDDDGLLVIHAQLIRARYLKLLREGLR
ncbi:MAG: hypothetical protein ABI355_19650 [Solirubrobacteraceae bacterium]